MHPRKRAQYISTEHAWIGYTHSYLLTCAPVSLHTVRVTAFIVSIKAGFFLPLFTRAPFCPCNAFILSLYKHCLSPNIIYVYHIQRWLKIFKEPHTARVFISHKCTELMPRRCIIKMIVKTMFHSDFCLVVSLSHLHYRWFILKMQQLF